MTLPSGGLAIVIGACSAMRHVRTDQLEREHRFEYVLRIARRCTPSFDPTDVAAIEVTAKAAKATGLPVRPSIDATGFLRDETRRPD